MSVVDSITIERAYSLVTGASTANAKRIGRHLRVQCPDRSHDDSRASCDLDVERNLWTCRSCPGASSGGGILDLAIVAGKARDHAEAAQWFEERIGASGRDSYVYADEHGNPVGRVDRIEPGRDGRTKDFIQFRFDGCNFIAGLNGEKLPLYHLDRVLRTARTGGTIFLVEGERKCDALQAAIDKIGSGERVVATTIASGAAAKLQPEHVAAFAGASKVIVLCDSDAPGRAAANLRARAIAQAHPNCDVRVVDLYADRTDGSDVADWLREEHTLKELRALVDAAPRVNHAVTEALHGTVTHDGVLTFDELALKGSMVVDWRIEGMLRESGILLLVSRPKVGKSDLARTLVKAFTSTGFFLGRRVKRGKVLWIGLEEPLSHLLERIELFGLQGPEIVWVTEQPEGDEAEWLAGVVERHRPENVVIDTIGRFAKIEDINHYSQVTRATQPILDIRSRFGTTFTLLHHTNAANKPLGSTMWEGVVDTIAILTESPDGKRFLQTRQRSGVNMEPTLVVQDADTGLVTAEEPKFLTDQRAAEQRILRYLGLKGAPAAREELANHSGRPTRIGRAAVDSLVSAGLVQTIGAGTRNDPRLYCLPKYPAKGKNTSGSQEGTYLAEESGLPEVFPEPIPEVFPKDSEASRTFPNFPEESGESNLVEYVPRVVDEEVLP